MNPNTPILVGDAAAIGALLGGTHGLLIALVIVLTLCLVVGVVQGLVARGKVAEELERLQKQAEWAEQGPTVVDGEPTA